MTVAARVPHPTDREGPCDFNFKDPRYALALGPQRAQPCRHFDCKDAHELALTLCVRCNSSLGLGAWYNEETNAETGEKEAWHLDCDDPLKGP